MFQNAVVYVDTRDPDYWLNADAEAKAPPNRKTTFTQSHQTVDPYVASGQLRTFDGATELFPGVSAVPEHGHTPGLTGYMIESRRRAPSTLGRYRARRRGAVPRSDRHRRIRRRSKRSHHVKVEGAQRCGETRLSRRWGTSVISRPWPCSCRTERIQLGSRALQRVPIHSPTPDPSRLHPLCTAPSRLAENPSAPIAGTDGNEQPRQGSAAPTARRPRP